MNRIYSILFSVFTFFCFTHFSIAQEERTLTLKKSSGNRIETIKSGEKIIVKLVGIDYKIKGTMASAGVLTGQLKSISENGFAIELDSNSLIAQDRGETFINVDLSSVEYIKAFSKRRKTTKILMMTIPATGVLTMLFVPYGIMPVAVLSPIWVPTIIIGAIMSKYEKFKVHNNKWVLSTS
jgi:hypothetical protein